MKIIVASEEDPVAKAVATLLGTGEATEHHLGHSRLRHLGGDRYLLRRPGLHIEDANLGEEVPATLLPHIEAMIFPSVHRSDSNRPALTVHPTGNLTPDAEVGGRPSALSAVPARLMTEAFLRWHEEGARLGIETTFEATHHGPLLDSPSFFIEIGSTPKEWEQPRALKALADLLLTVEVARTAADPVVVGVGGGHYMPRFRDLVRKRKVAVGHLVPSHDLPSLDAAMAAQLVQRSAGAVGVILAKAADNGSSSALLRLLPELHERTLPPR